MRLNVNARPRANRRRYLLVCLLLGLASLACSLAPKAATEPIFMAPGGINFEENQPAAQAQAPLETAEAAPPLPSTTAVLPLDTVLAIPSPTQVEPTAEPTRIPTALPSPTPTQPVVNTTPLLYYTQAGDTLPVVAVRFGVEPDEITSPEPIPETALFNPGQLLIIPNRLANTTSSQHLMPDSEIVYSPSAIDFDIAAFSKQAGGYLDRHIQYLASTGLNTGPEVVARVAIENSINPRILLALLEYQSGWVYGDPVDQEHVDFAMGKVDEREKGFYQQLAWALNQLSIGYYGWREGRLTEIQLSDGVTARLAPDLNAGTAALQYYFAQVYDSEGWIKALDPKTGFPALYEQMFGSPWVRAQAVEPLYPPDLVQPPLSLPFTPGQIWAFTGGPHGAWERDGAWAAIDFAPGSTQSGCVDNNKFAVASAAGLVTRSENGVLALDLDGDGREETGWVLIYLHLAEKGRVPKGAWVEAGDPLGHPSCEGGYSTGTHLHIARKYNGEWIVADGPLPFVLGGWTVHAGELPYQGTMTRGEEVVRASVLSPSYSRIIRGADDP
jgi:LasA protease